MLTRAEKLLEKTPFVGFPVVAAEEETQVLGYIDRKDLRLRMGEFTADIALTSYWGIDEFLDSDTVVTDITPCYFDNEPHEVPGIDFSDLVYTVS